MAGYLALKVLEVQGDNGDQQLLNNNEINSAAEETPAGDDSSRLPREELLLSVKSNDEPRLRHALQHSNPQDLNLVFPHPDSCTLLHIATLNNSVAIAKVLLDAGASPDIRDLRGKKFTALHYAAQIGSPEIIRLLLEKGADANVKEGEFGRTCLHLLTSKWKKTFEENFNQSLNEFLKSKKIKIDRQDSSGVTPLFLAAQKGWEYMVKTLIYKGASLDTGVGSKTTKEIINKKLPDLLDTINFSEIEKVQRCYGDDLYEALKDENIEMFKDILNEINEKDKSSKKLILEEDHGEYTLLNYACDLGLHEFVDLLLKEETDPTHADKTTFLCPILYAAKNGYYKVMESLTENMKKIGVLKQGALKVVDRKLETALHKVVKREQPLHNEGVDYLRCLQILLNLKTYLSIDAQDAYDSTPLHYAVLCDDQSFVRYLLINGAHLGIKNKFGTLAITRIQPSVLEDVLNDCVKFKNNITDRDFEIILHYSMLAPTGLDYRPETDCLKFLSGSRPHRHLLRHPIIDTFLFLKWQRIRHYYFINLAAYSTFLILLTTYIMLFYGTIKKSLLPTDEVSSFNNTLSAENNEMYYNEFTIKLILQILLLIFLIFGAMRELTQFFVSWKTYAKRLENLLELSILLMTIVLLFIPMSYVSLQGISAWLILFSWVELVLILGRHPKFAVYITMFTTVTFNFLKFILMFSFVIIAFSLSFYLLFQINDTFVTYPKTLLKTIAMSTGEIEYTELPLSDFPFSSHLLFVIFVFIIVLVLMNLLNGLAVSDIQLIQQEAELVSYRSRVELISYIESAFLINPYSKQSGGRLCDQENCCFRACLSSSNPALRMLNYLGRRTLMFCNCLRDHRITVFPNRGKDRWHVCSCHSFQLEEYQIEAAKSVLLAEEGRVADRLAGLESRVDSVISAIKSLTDLVQRKEIKLGASD